MYKQKYPDHIYLTFDPYESGTKGDDPIAGRKVKLVTTRKEHKCYGLYMGIDHIIPAGSRCYFEKAFLDGHPVSNYLCLECYDKYLEDILEDIYGPCTSLTIPMLLLNN